MNLKGHERKWSLSNTRYYPGTCLGRQKKPRKPSVRKVHVPAEMQIGHLLVTSLTCQKLYCLSQLAHRMQPSFLPKRKVSGMKNPPTKLQSPLLNMTSTSLRMVEFATCPVSVPISQTQSMPLAQWTEATKVDTDHIQRH
jgi:hypothetical protein